MPSLSAVIRAAALAVDTAAPVPPDYQSVLPPRDPRNYRLSSMGGLKFKERDDFIKGFVGEIIVDPPGIEADILAKGGGHITGDTTLDSHLYYAASFYQQLTQKGARLPKFTRWVTSLWPKEPRYVELFAKLGQAAAQDTFYVSDRQVDILRCASTTHFSSCFRSNDSPARVCAEGTGVAIIFCDDEKGAMKRRTWCIHVRDPKTQRDGLFVMPGRYGNFDEKKIIAKLKEKHPEVDFYYTAYPAPKSTVQVQLVTGFKSYIYFDHNMIGNANLVKYEG